MALITDQIAWWAQRAEATQAAILVYEAAIEAVSTGQSYTLDTGQTRQTVTRANVTELRLMLASLENRLSQLLDRINGGGAHYGRPGY
jgi:hypothetical protein